MRVLGMPTITIDGTATATTGMPPYIDFYMLLDNTPSMGVAATPADGQQYVRSVRLRLP
jgi:hypothetical protein